jgi:PAS domain S-box-containing protein
MQKLSPVLPQPDRAIKFLSSLRVRLVGLVLLAVIPALGLILYNAAQQRREAALETQENLLRLTRLAATNQKQQTEAIRQLLVTFTQLPPVRSSNWAECSRLLADLNQQFPNYVSLGVIAPNGDLQCSSLPITRPVNLSDRLHFQLVRQTKRFAVGEYQIGKLSGRENIAFGYPILDQAGQLQAVVAAGLDLKKLNSVALVTPLPEGAVVVVVDRNSTVLLRYPNPERWVGKSFPDAQINQKVLTQAAGTVKAPGIDGVERLYAFSRLGDDPVNGSISIRIGIPTTVAFAHANQLLTQNLISLGGATLLALAIAWFGGDLFLVRKVKSLVRTTERLRQGDLAARTTLSDSGGELGLLARSFNDMAIALEQRDQAIAQLNHDLQLQLTQLQTTQNNLETSEDRLQLALLAGRMGTWDWNMKTDAIVWSEGHFRLLGLEPYESEPSYALWASHVHPEDLAATEAALRQARMQGSEYRAEYRVVWRDGTIVWVEGRGRLAFDTEGQPDCMIGVIVDVNDRKQAELELRQRNAILDVINESAPALIFVKDRQGKIIYANPATLAVLGKSKEEVIGYYDSDLYPDNAAAVMENDRRVMESEQMEVVEESPDGVRTFLGMKVPYRNEAGEVIGLIGISNDITDRVQLERDREQLLQREQAARAAAENANRIKDEFLAVLSHELRTPMNPILGWAKLLRNGKLSDTKTTLAIETIERNAQLQVQLIDDLLDISRILQGKLSFNNSVINLAVVIRAAMETVRLAAEAKAIAFQPFSSADLFVQGDAGRLQQVIWNLLSNAVKFTPAGGQVAVELSQVGMDAQIQVRDTGKGIKPEFLPYVFEHFRQEDGATTRKFGGLGLGLAIARQIIELHGGQIRVESLGEDQGATFIVQIPLPPNPLKAPSPNLPPLPSA